MIVSDGFSVRSGPDRIYEGDDGFRPIGGGRRNLLPSPAVPVQQVTTGGGTDTAGNTALAAKAATAYQPTETPEQHYNRLWEERHQDNQRRLHLAAANINRRHGNNFLADQNLAAAGAQTGLQYQAEQDANARSNTVAGADVAERSSRANFNNALTRRSDLLAPHQANEIDAGAALNRAGAARTGAETGAIAEATRQGAQAFNAAAPLLPALAQNQVDMGQAQTQAVRSNTAGVATQNKELRTRNQTLENQVDRLRAQGPKPITPDQQLKFEKDAYGFEQQKQQDATSSGFLGIGGGSRLKPIPRALADQYLQHYGGNRQAAKAAAQGAGYDPNVFAD